MPSISYYGKRLEAYIASRFNESSSLVPQTSARSLATCGVTPWVPWRRSWTMIGDSTNLRAYSS